MFWPIYVYVIASLAIAGSAAVNAGWGPAVYAITTSSLFLAAGGGWKASLWWGDYAQKPGGTVVAALIVVLAQWLSSGFSVGLFGHAMSGTAWGGLDSSSVSSSRHESWQDNRLPWLQLSHRLRPCWARSAS